MKAMKKKSVSKIAKGVCKGHGAAWQQGEDRRWLDCQRLVQEQARQDCEQEEHGSGKQESMDAGCCEGTQGLEDHRLCCGQEGHASVRQGEGVFWQLSTVLSA